MNKTSSQLKGEAKAALRGRWKEAILLNLVPSLLSMLSAWVIGIAIVGVSIFSMFLVSMDTDTSLDSTIKQEQRGDVYERNNNLGKSDNNVISDVSTNISTSPGGFFSKTLLPIIISFMTIGISFTFVELLRNPSRKINPMADQFRMFNGKDFVPLLLIQILNAVFIYLWSLLFIIPGIIKRYSYSQSFYIYKDLSEHTNAQATSALNYISESRSLMKGNKGRLFYIDLSFLGWQFLCWLTLGLGYFVLNPYMNATKAAFYRDISKDRYASPVVVANNDDEWTNF